MFLYWPYSNEIFYTKALEYKEYFSQIDLWGIPRNSRDIRDFLEMKYRMFGQAVGKIHDCFGLCNVMTEFDPPFERLFYEDFNGGFHFKGGGGVNTR